MSTIKIKNHIHLFLQINQNSDNTHSFQYLCRMGDGVVVNLQGLHISEPSKITIELTNVTNVSFDINQCLVPCDQKTVTAEINCVDGQNVVTLIDRDNEIGLEDYNFIIIAVNRHTKEQIVCDPQIRNRGTM